MKQIMKEGDVFLYCNEQGDIPPNNFEGYGLYYRDTRYLSRYDWELEGIPLLTLTGKAKGAEGIYRYTNREVSSEQGLLLCRESLEVVRERWICDGVLYERFRLANLGRRPVETCLTFRLDADFADMFVVRGFMGGKLGKRDSVTFDGSRLTFSYLGVDGVARRTEVFVEPSAEMDGSGQIRIPVKLVPGERMKIRLEIALAEGGKDVTVLDEEEALQRVRQREREWRSACPEVKTDSPHFQLMMETSLADFRMLLCDAGDGELPVAGLPWFAVPFGRDSLIAALQALPIRPELAKAVIRTMARFQGTVENTWRDEEPGKIMHEIRFGELARSGQVPFTPYYGTIDATPLFLILIAEVYRFTGDLEFVREFAQSARKAFEWIDRFGNPDGSGYTSYVRKSEKGIDNQGWKDSGDSIVHRDGRLAEAPIALCEVQGYVYMARRQWSKLFRLLGDIDESKRLAVQAEDLKHRFNRDFWMEDEQFVALALDRQRQQVGTVTSNPGHCLMTGILDEEKARHVAMRLLAKDMFSGWGIRTMSNRAAAYNPMSYHNGSVWPHDNSLILLGLQEMGFHDEACRVMEGLIDAASHFADYRLPELFCGYDREEGEPVPYPIACSPQAWAAGTVFVLLRTMLGLKPEPEQKRVVLSPVLPSGIGYLRVSRLRVGSGHLDVTLIRADGKVHVSVDHNTTGWSVVIS